jgi:hypothetical protein
MSIVRVFAGFDPREEVGYHAFCSSVIHRASEPVSIAPVRAEQRDGSNAFTYARFAIPRMCDYNGWAIFMDGSDMVCVGDIAELWDMRDHSMCVQVVKHDYKTRHPRKYVGTQMEAANEDYLRKNWSSVMLINCAHPDWRYARVGKSGSYLHRFEFTDRIGTLPAEWNWLVDEAGPNADAKVLHWTAGIPAFPHYKDAPMAAEWFKAHALANQVTA